MDLLVNAFLDTQRSLHDSKLESGGEQGPSSWEVFFIKQNFYFLESQEWKGQSEKFNNQ
jgi:hypothetical protein